MEAASRVRVFLPGVQVFRVVIPAVRGRRALPTSRIQPLVGHCAVNGGVVVASDQTVWEGLQWRTLLDRLVKRGATIEEVTRGGIEGAPAGEDVAPGANDLRAVRSDTSDGAPPPGRGPG